MDTYFIEVSFNRDCKCGGVTEAFIVEASSREQAVQKVKEKLVLAKDILFKYVYRCDIIGNGIKVAYTRY